MHGLLWLHTRRRRFFKDSGHEYVHIQINIILKCGAQNARYQSKRTFNQVSLVPKCKYQSSSLFMRSNTHQSSMQSRSFTSSFTTPPPHQLALLSPSSTNPFPTASATNAALTFPSNSHPLTAKLCASSITLSNTSLTSTPSSPI